MLCGYFMGLLAARMHSRVYEVPKGGMLVECRFCSQYPKSQYLLILVLISTMEFLFFSRPPLSFSSVPCLISSSPKTFAFPHQPYRITFQYLARDLWHTLILILTNPNPKHGNVGYTEREYNEKKTQPLNSLLGDRL